MQALIVEFRIHAAHVEAFAQALAANARASREREPSCRQFDVCRDAADPGLFFLYELYDDEAAVQAHLRAPHFLEMDRLTRDWVAAKTVRRMRRTEPSGDQGMA
jgi:(4S)-4-hydroxy-5-phosphonooxypentane-2,3-dione isomerase